MRERSRTKRDARRADQEELTVIELGNLLLLHRKTRGENEVDEGMDVGLLGEVEGGVGLVAGLSVFEILRAKAKKVKEIRNWRIRREKGVMKAQN